MKKFYLMIFAIISLAGMLAISGCKKKETYTVTFNANGGTGTMAAQTFTEGEAQALTRNAFTYDGYTFTGWNTVQGGSGASYSDQQTITATADMTLYAQWTSNGTNPTPSPTPGPTPPSPAGSPTVETGSTEITGVSVIFSGNVTAAGDAPVTARGFMYGTSASALSNSVECGTGTGDFTTEAIAVDLYTTYYYKAYATNSVGTAYGEIKEFVFSATAGNQNGHVFVDLGLSSGTKWATCNVGANNPEGYGDYFAWGETTPKETYNWRTYRYCNGDYNKLTKYCNNAEYGNDGFTDALTTLEASDDAATANWGSVWRMPTQTELNELKNSCTVTWVTYNGVNGRLFTGPNGNSIFLPAAGGRVVSELYNAGSYGNYWSSSFSTDLPYRAWHLYFYSDYYGMNSYDRSYGQSVRPVCVQ
ncbi:MAG: InlB B-repeat-containing protein [Bacteroidales bacterium]|nr:InlB B-repeat-containing protein [Bacteroidales bacterium]